MDRTIAFGSGLVLVLIVAIGFVAFGQRTSASIRHNSGSGHDDGQYERGSPSRSSHAATDTPSRVGGSTTVVDAAGGSVNAAWKDTDFTVLAREQLGKDPTLALRLARAGNQRFPASPEAAERAWIVVKSLTDMGAFDEARVEARAMVDRYRHSSWALDVARHVLSHPPGPPAGMAR